MNRILSQSQMAQCDELAQTKYGIDSLVLMERAALACVSKLYEKEYDLTRVLILCGTGNNGGDGLAIARILAEKGVSADIYVVGKLSKASASFKKQYMTLEALGIKILDTLPTGSYTTGIDALFGISLNRDIEGEYLEAVSFFNESCVKILSVDIPSGIRTDDGFIMGIAVRADDTVTFGFLKKGLMLYPGAEYAGRVSLSDIGIPKATLLDMEKEETDIFSLSDEELVLPKRPAYSNKGTFGKVLLVVGSKEMPGAALLSALACMRAGAGMIKIVTAIENRDIFARTIPEAMLLCYAGELIPEAGIEEALDWCDCAIIGPGIGRDDIAVRLVQIVLSQNKVPVVVDADALNIISKMPELLSGHPQDIIVTPHVGEMSRLTGLDTAEIAAHLVDTASDFAKNYNLICVLKDARTIIAGYKGDAFINPTGNSGMATAGSGDVLSGIIAALVAYGMKPFEAACLGCGLHGKAGDTGSRELSEHELLARDIIKYLE